MLHVWLVQAGKKNLIYMDEYENMNAYTLQITFIFNANHTVSIIS